MGVLSITGFQFGKLNKILLEVRWKTKRNLLRVVHFGLMIIIVVLLVVSHGGGGELGDD